MRSMAQILREARNKYAANPSHAPYRHPPEPGRHCVCTAVDSAGGWDEMLEVLARTAGVRPVPVAGGRNDYRLPMIKWNARVSTERVLAVFDRAIAKEEAGS